MMLRPATASWFELLTSREELGAALDCLADTGSVQLQAHSQSESKLALPELRGTLVEFETLARRYSHYWPPAHVRPLGPDHDLLEAPRAALENLRAWATEADPVISELQNLAQLRDDTELLTALHTQADAAMPRLDRVANAGPVLAGRVYLLAEAGLPQAIPPAILVHRITRAEGDFVVAVGPADDVATLYQSLVARKARSVGLPADLPADPARIASHLVSRRDAIAERERVARDSLEALATQHGLPQALGELSLASWLVTHVPE